MLILLLGLLYYELTAKEYLPQIWAVFLQHCAHSNLSWLILALLLMPFNWLAETQKWFQILRRYEPMRLETAYRAVLAGVAVSLFTPNRVGEYGGRIIFVQPANRWKAVIINLVGNYAQTLVLLAAGLVAMLWMGMHYAHLAWGYTLFLALLAGLFLRLMFALYFNLSWIQRWVEHWWVLKPVKRFVKDWTVLEQFNRKELLDVLKWATLRYVIFSTQYFLLLQFFDIQTGLLAGYAGIASLFLLQTIIPLPPLTGLVARGNLAVQVWGLSGANEISSLAATFALWIINLILPALVGTFSILCVNIAKTIVYENDKH